MIKKYSLKALETAINHALSLDENITQKMTPFRGKVIEIIIAPLEITFFITFTPTGLNLIDNYEGPPNTIIHSTPLGLIRLSFLPASEARSLFNKKIRLSGDIELGEQIKRLFDELDIDWESHLAHFTGDVAAYQISSIVKKGLDFQRGLTKTIQRSLTEYIQEEVRLFPTGEELNDFFNDVDYLAQDIERLEAQIKLLVGNNEGF